MRQIASQVEDILRSAPRPGESAMSGRARARRCQPEYRSRSRQSGGHHELRCCQLSYRRLERRAGDHTAGRRPQHPGGRAPSMDERAQFSDIQNLYVYGSQSSTKIPLVQISNIENSMSSERIIRLDHFRSMSVFAFPAPGHLSSEITTMALPKLRELEKTLPPGYGLRIGGEYDKQQDWFQEPRQWCWRSRLPRSIWHCSSSSTMPSNRSWCLPPRPTA